MARTLANTALTTGIIAVLAYEDDGDTLKCWTTPGASTNVALTTGSLGTRLTAQTFGSSTASGIVTGTNSRISLTTPIALSMSAGDFLSIYAAVLDYDNFNSSAGIITDFSATADSHADYYGASNGPGAGVNVIATALTIRGSGNQVLPANTKFGVGATLQFQTAGGSDISQFYYGTAGSTMSDDGPTAADNSNIGVSGFSLRSFLNTDGSTYNREFGGKVMLVAVRRGQWSNADFNTLNADPINALFGAGGGTKKLKLLMAASAVGAVVTGGIVWADQASAIAGAETGEFTGSYTVVAGTGGDTGYGVLKVPAADFGGSGLANSTTVQVYVKNATNFTPIWPATIITE